MGDSIGSGTAGEFGSRECPSPSGGAARLGGGFTPVIAEARPM